MTDTIGIMKAALWEEAKGKLRALTAVSGQAPSADKWRSEQWPKVEQAIEAFINDFENEALHE